jgi:hypothetical protein
VSKRKIKKEWKKFREGRRLDWPWGFTCKNPGSGFYVENLVVPDLFQSAGSFPLLGPTVFTFDGIGEITISGRPSSKLMGEEEYFQKWDECLAMVKL